MTRIDSGTGTVLITGPTRGLGRDLTLELARRAAAGRPDLIVVGRPGDRLTDITETARAAGATVETVSCDLSRLADVRAAASAAKGLLAVGAVRPLRALVANAGVSVTDTRGASADGYEMTLARRILHVPQRIGATPSISPAQRRPRARRRSKRPALPTPTPNSRSSTTPASCSDASTTRSRSRSSNPASCQAPRSAANTGRSRSGWGRPSGAYRSGVTRLVCHDPDRPHHRTCFRVVTGLWAYSGCSALFPNGTGILGRLSLLDRAEGGSLVESAASATNQKRRPARH